MNRKYDFILGGGVCGAAERRKYIFNLLYLIFVYGSLMCDYSYDYDFLEDFTRIVQFRQLKLVNFDFVFLSIHNVA